MKANSNNQRKILESSQLL